MGSILTRLIDILRLRSGPQDMPAGWNLAIVLGLAYIAQGFFIDQILGDGEAAPRSLLAITVQFLAIATLLNIKKFAGRLAQTLSTLAGTGLIFGFLSILLVSLWLSFHSSCLPGRAGTEPARAGHDLVCRVPLEPGGGCPYLPSRTVDYNEPWRPRGRYDFFSQFHPD